MYAQEEVDVMEGQRMALRLIRCILIAASRSDLPIR